MTEFTVRYTLNNSIYETKVSTASSGSAISWVLTLFPTARNITVV